MARLSADQLREIILALMTENAQVRAVVGGHDPVLAVDTLGAEYDAALDEINQARAGVKAAAIETDLTFKLETIDTLMRRMEAQGRVHGRH